MKNTIANRKAICDTLMAAAEKDRDIVALCSDSRGSASMTPFFEKFPDQSVEVGVAEQDLVSISAGLAACGKKPYAFSPASFISTRSYEQAKVDCAYSDTNVKLVGISGGVSYGALGMSHHSAQDIAAMSAIPNMRVYLPSDRFQTALLIKALLQDASPAYIRVGRNPVEDSYTEENCPFVFGRATVSSFNNGDRDCFAAGEKAIPAADVTIIACGEMVRNALDAAETLSRAGVSVNVLDMYSVKPLDREAVVESVSKSRFAVTVEEHAPFGGLGSMVAQVVCAECPKKVIELALPDAPVITGTSPEVFAYYGLDASGIEKTVREAL